MMVPDSVVNDAYIQLGRIEDYLVKNFPLDFSEGELVSDAVIKILGRHKAEIAIFIASEAVFGEFAR